MARLFQATRQDETYSSFNKRFTRLYIPSPVAGTHLADNMTRLIAKENIMVASISSSTVGNWSDSLFNKLDTKKQGYVDPSDLAAALGADATGATTNSDDAAAMLKQIDGDGDGKITKSELSTAISKVADELNAQFDSSRVDKSQAAPAASTDETADDDSPVAATGSASGASAARGAPPAGGGGSSTESTNKYSAAADTDSNGTVSDAEAAAYKKLMASSTEHKHGAGPGGKAGSAEDADSDKDRARALDQLKQYVDNSGDSSAVSGASAQNVDVSA
jgi:hypothetical protein